MLDLATSDLIAQIRHFSLAHRIGRRLQSLIRMTQASAQKKLCFVIGPMADLSRLNRLAKNIVAPVVEPLGYEVKIPEQPDIGNVMDQVVELLDRADLVVGDLTGGNPNVFYELGIRHSLGLVYVVLKEKAPALGKTIADEKTPFDLAAYRYTTVDFDDMTQSIDQVRHAVEKATQALQGIVCPNPVTNYYRAPMTEVNLAAGLAFGYYHNFVQPVALAMADKDESDKYTNEVTVNKVAVTDQAVRDSLRLKIVIPQTLEQVDTDFVGDQKKRLVEVKVSSQRRPFFVYAKPAVTPEFLLDFPTTMNVMRDALMKRLSMSTPEYTDRRWQTIEQQQIGQFRTTVDRYIKNNSRVQKRAATCSWDEMQPW